MKSNTSRRKPARKQKKLLDKNHENIMHLLKACELYEKYLAKQTGVKDHTDAPHKKFRSDRSYINSVQYRAILALKMILLTKHTPQEKIRHFAAAFADYEPRFLLKTTKEKDKVSMKFLDTITNIIPFLNHGHTPAKSKLHWQQLNANKKPHVLSNTSFDRRGTH